MEMRREVGPATIACARPGGWRARVSGGGRFQCPCRWKWGRGDVGGDEAEGVAGAWPGVAKGWACLGRGSCVVENVTVGGNAKL